MCVCIRKTGRRSGDFLWLLLCASIFRTVCTILGTQCKGVRIWLNTAFAGRFNDFTNTITSSSRYVKLFFFFPLMCLDTSFSVVSSSNYYVSLLYLICSKQQLLLGEKEGLASSASHPHLAPTTTPKKGGGEQGAGKTFGLGMFQRIGTR